MKLAFFIPDLGGGGAEKVLVTLANYFSENGIKVDIVVSSSRGPYKKRISPTVRLIDFQKKRTSNCIFPLVKYIRREQPDFLISFLGYANVIAIISKLLSLKKIRLIISERNLIPPSGELPLKNKFIRVFMQLLYPYADRIIAISNYVANSITKEIKVSSSMIDVIYNPIINDYDVKHHEDPPALVSELTNKSISIFLSIGRLVKIKDHESLLKAFNLVVSKAGVRKPHLIIIGDGPEKKNILNQINNLNLSDHVTLVGFIDNPLTYLKHADLFISHSLSEGFSNVVLEAMLAGTKIISTSSGGPNEILENGKWGEIVEIGNIEALSNAMDNALNKQNRISYENRLNDFVLSKIASEYMTSFKKTII